MVSFAPYQFYHQERSSQCPSYMRLCAPPGPDWTQISLLGTEKRPFITQAVTILTELPRLVEEHRKER
jgi:hypothetical protein